MIFIPFIIYFSGTLKNIHKYLAVLSSNGYLNRLTNYGLIDNMGELLEKNCFMSHKIFSLEYIKQVYFYSYLHISFIRLLTSHSFRYAVFGLQITGNLCKNEKQKEILFSHKKSSGGWFQDL